MRLLTGLHVLLSALAFTSVLAAPIDPPAHWLAARAPPLTAAPNIGDIVGLSPKSTNGQLKGNANLAHPTIVLSSADSKGRFTVGLISHNSAQNTPNVDVSTLVPAAEASAVQLQTSKGVTPLEGFVFTGSPVKVPQTALVQATFAPGSATSVSTSTVNKFLGHLRLPVIADDAADDVAKTAAKSGVVGDAETAVKDVTGDAEGAAKGAVKDLTGSVSSDVKAVAKAAGGSLGKDAETAAKHLGKDVLKHGLHF